MTLTELAKRLHQTTPFSHIDQDQLLGLLEQSGERQAGAGTELAAPDRQLLDHLVILEGALEARRVWSTAGRREVVRLGDRHRGGRAGVCFIDRLSREHQRQGIG
ncbi:MAG: hypothetical protein WBM84_13480 [Sedimenticolaceae bacterium]